MCAATGCRLHSFLEQWGLINYGIVDGATPSVGPRADVHYQMVPDPFAGGTVPALLNPTSQLFFTEALQRQRDYLASRSKAAEGESATADSAAASAAAAPSQAPAARAAGQATSLGNADIRPELHADLLGRDWTDRQRLKLLEAIDLHGDNWVRVARHVGEGRTPQQCVAEFVRLPIDEPYRNAVTAAEEDSQLPFLNASNPVMALIAYLTNMVSPSAAAAAAQAALGTRALRTAAHRLTRAHQRRWRARRARCATWPSWRSSRAATAAAAR